MNQKTNIMKNMEFNFTKGKWGGFDMGEGEYFKKNFLSNIKKKGNDTDFVIITEEVSEGVFETTFIPNPINLKDMSSWNDKDLIDLFTNAITYRTTKEDAVRRFEECGGKVGIYEFIDDAEVIEVDDMMWWFLDFCSSGTIVLKVPFMEHPKTKEFLKLIENV